MGKRPTILDVAKHAGVSKSTVSLVLQNSTLVKETTHADVMKAITDLGYVYDRSAAGLRGAGTGLVGLVINDLHGLEPRTFHGRPSRAFGRDIALRIAGQQRKAALRRRNTTTLN